MKNIFYSLQFVTLFYILLSIILPNNSLSQNYWETTSGPGTVVVYDFLFKDNFILTGTWIGGMYKTTNGGETWQQLENEFVDKSVYALELLPNGNILAGTGSGIHISSDNGETWFHSALPDYLVSNITVDQAGSVYAGSIYGNNIYKSVDNGMTWDTLNSEIVSVRDIQVIGADKILVAAGGNIFRSSDAGNSWTKVFQVTDINIINSLTLNQSGNVSAISEYGNYFLSSDDGVTWDSISTISRSSRTIYSSNNGDLYLGSYGVYRSTNEGQTWNFLNGFQGSGLVRSIAEHENSFYAGTYFSGVFRSTNSGNNWVQSSKGINHSTVILFEKDYTGKIFAVSAQAGFSTTSDNGESWEILGTMSALNSLSASPNGYLFASIGAVFSGVIFRSSDGGHTWETLYENSDTTVSQVNVNIDSSVYALLSHKLFKSTNNGDSWFHIQIAAPDEYINSITFNNIGDIFIKSALGYFRSSDNGETWEQLISTPEGLNIFGITISDVMFASASDSNFYNSTDYGDTWNYLTRGNGKSIRSFASNDIGYLFILEHFNNVLRSTDQGLNWQEINSGLDEALLNCLIITDDDYLLLGSSRKGVYRSVNKTTSVENKFVELSNSFSLEQNYPNPFNPTTKIRYQISQNSNISLKIFDVLGNEIITLVNQEKSAGKYEIDFDGSILSSGIYFYQLKAGDLIETRKMILIK